MKPASIALSPVESSQIHSIGHDPETNTMAVRFKSWKGEATSLYHYANVSADDFAAMRDAESIYRHFAATFKADPEKYPFTRIGETEGSDDE